MKAICNTTVFFSPSIEGKVREELRSRGPWSRVLLMDPEPGIMRVALQQEFESKQAAEAYLESDLMPMLSQLTHKFGHEKFTGFPTIMEEIEL